MKDISSQHELIIKYYIMGILFVTVKKTEDYRFYYLFNLFPFFRILKKPKKTTYRLLGVDILRKKTDGSFILDKTITIQERKQNNIVYMSIGALATDDMETGIGRVVRSYIGELFRLQSEFNFELIPIYRNERKYGYIYARQYVETYFPDYLKPYEKIEFSHSSHFIEMTTDSKGINSNYNFLLFLKRHGIYLHLFVYDLIAFSHPFFFTKERVSNFSSFLKLSSIFGHIICDSKSVASDYNNWRATANSSVHQIVDYCYLSGNFDDKAGNIIELATREYEQILKSKFLLSVSTLEPRKGYVKAVRIFESLWEEGFDLSYVIIGRKGWNYRNIVKTITQSKYYNKRLFWFDRIEDSVLPLFYQRCQAVFVPSEAEGFGLPLAEASYYDKSVIANNIDVFKEIAPSCCYFFELNDCQVARETIEKWYKDNEKGQERKIDRSVFPSWEGSARRLISLILSVKTK